MQIKWTEIQSYCEPTIEESNIDKWLRTEFCGSSPQKVLSISEDRTVDWYLQFHVPRKLEVSFPKEASLDGKKFLVEHARPYAPAHSNSSRPPLKKACVNIGRKLRTLHQLKRRIVPTVLPMLRAIFLRSKDQTCCKRSASRVVG